MAQRRLRECDCRKPVQLRLSRLPGQAAELTSRLIERTLRSTLIAEGWPPEAGLKQSRGVAVSRNPGVYLGAPRARPSQTQGTFRRRVTKPLRPLLDAANGGGRPGRGALSERDERAILYVTQHNLLEHEIACRDVLFLLDQGFRVDAICSAGLYASPALKREGLRLYIVPVRHRRGHIFRYLLEYTSFFAAALALVSLLSLRRRYAVAQVDNLPDTLVFTTAVPRLRGMRIVLNMFELTPEMVAARFPAGPGRLLTRIAKLIEGLAIRWADHVIVVSDECRRRVRSRGVASDKLTVVLNTTSFSPAGLSEARPGWLDTPDQPPFVVTHTTLVKRYGVDVLLGAFPLLRARWPQLKLRVIGDGDQRPALERLAAELGVADAVVFTGRLPWHETLAQVRQAAVGVVPVLADGYGQLLLPTKLLEYTRLRVPAACARLDAVLRYFPEDSLAYFTPGDAGELAAAIDGLLRDPAHAVAQTERAFEVAQSMSWERVQEDYLAALGLANAPYRGELCAGRRHEGVGATTSFCRTSVRFISEEIGRGESATAPPPPRSSR